MKAYKYHIDDDEFGRIRIRFSRLARCFIFRADDAGLTLTCNPLSGDGAIRHAIDILRPKLREMLERHVIERGQTLLQPDCGLSSDLFKLQWIRTDKGRLTVCHRPECMTVHYCESADFADPAVQRWLVSQLNRNLTMCAKAVLPHRLGELAEKNGFVYSSVRIHRTHTRWGSCNARGNINLSSYIVLLPPHLRDYVMLHELCHTREMSHSPKFWALLNGLVDGKSDVYNSEMRSRNISGIIAMLQSGG